MKTTPIFATLGLSFVLFAGGAGAQDMAKLAKGDIDIKSSPVKGSDTPKIVMTAMVDSPPEKVWQIVSDCSKYKGRLPRVAAAKMLSKSGKTQTCEVTIEMPLPLSNLTAVTEATHEESKDLYARRWKLVRGDYKKNEGSWVIKPFGDDKTKSLVVYTVHAEPITPVPAFIREKAQRSALPDLIERVRAESKKVK